MATKEIHSTSVVKCTACHCSVNHNDLKTLYRHPALNVLICKKCSLFYTKGEWSRDEDGQDEYCRWCGEGGSLYICSSSQCLRGFCRSCIRNNLGKSEIKRVENDDAWQCYLCNPDPLKVVQCWTDKLFSYSEASQISKALITGPPNALQSRKQELSDSYNTLVNALRHPKGASVEEVRATLSSMMSQVRTQLYLVEQFVQSDAFVPHIRISMGDEVKASKQRSTSSSANSSHTPNFEEPIITEVTDQIEDVKSTRLGSNRRSSARGKENRIKIKKESSPYEQGGPNTEGHIDSMGICTSEEAVLKINGGRHRSPSPVFSENINTGQCRSPFADSADDDGDSRSEKSGSDIVRGGPVPCIPPSTTTSTDSFRQLSGLLEQSVPSPKSDTSSGVQTASPKSQASRSSSSEDRETAERDHALHNSNYLDDDQKDSACIAGNDVDNETAPNVEENHRSASDSSGDSSSDSESDDSHSNNDSSGDDDDNDDKSDENEGGDGGDREKDGRSDRNNGKKRRGNNDGDDESDHPKDNDEVQDLPSLDEFKKKELIIRLSRVETVLAKQEANPLPKRSPGPKSRRQPGFENANNEDDELLRLLEDPVRRNVLKADLDRSQMKTTKRHGKRAVAKKNAPKIDSIFSDDSDDESPQQTVEISDNDAAPNNTGDDDSDFEVKMHKKSEQRAEVDSDSDVEVIAEVRASKRNPVQKKNLEMEKDSPAKGGDAKKDTNKRSLPSIPKEADDDSKDKHSKTKRKADNDSDSDPGVGRPRRAARLRAQKKARIVDSDDEDFQQKDEVDLSPIESDSGSALEEEQKPKKKRKKKKTAIEDSDEENKEAEEDSPAKRKYIRKIMSDDKIQKDTRTAAKEEAERRRRVLERQKAYNEIEAALKKDRKDDKVTSCVLEYDQKSKEPTVQVDPALAVHMKPHQVDGVKFLYNTVIESIEQLQKAKGDSTTGGGAILAHCMGLGKTFQTICLIHTMLTHKVLHKHIQKIIVVCPCNVVLNWAREFEIWIDENEDVKGNLNVFEFSRVKNIYDRVDMLEHWSDQGGVLIMGYSMFRVMTQMKTKSRKIKDKIPKLLHDPGADLVVCDEGHMLKSDKAQISKAMNLIKTRRRIILTGTPLQNNMSEYHCMVSFVKPNLLGTQKEFNNRFMNPITHGQTASASQWHVKLMKKRVHILSKLLAGCVHRCDYSHLTPYLPAKFEYIVSVDLSELQMKLYREYLKSIGITEDTTREDLRNRSLLKDYQVLKMVWSHPYLLLESADRQEDKRQREAFRNDEDEFIDDGSDEESPKSQSGSGTSDEDNGSASGTDEVVKKYCTRRNRQEGLVESEPEEEPTKVQKHKKAWWNSLVPQDEEELMKLELSSKLTLALDILRQCELIGDKVILFSTSLLTLDLFEKLLQVEYDRTSRETVEGDYINSWVHGQDYFRLDGSTAVDTRKKYIDAFNDLENLRARLFLVSTRAGGIGTNMIGANRILMVDASWNPSDDTQAIFRAYRYGQTKPVYVYRLLAHATMEEKIYDRQVNKISLACRVVDEQNLERHFNEDDLKALYEFNPDKDARKTPAVPKDRLLAELLIAHKDIIQGYHEHDSLLQKELEDELTEEERKTAWKEYEDERDGKATYMPYNTAGMAGIPNTTGMPGTAAMPGMAGMPGMSGTLPPGITPGSAYHTAYMNYIRQQHANMINTMRHKYMQEQQQQAGPHHSNQQQQQPRPTYYENLQQQQQQQQYQEYQQQAAAKAGAMPHNWQEILRRPPHFNFRIKHPSLDPTQILNEVKLRNPTTDQLTIAVLYKTALAQKKNFYLVNLQRARSSAEAYQRQMKQVPKVILNQFEENQSAVRILDSLVPKLEETIQEARKAMALARKNVEAAQNASTSQPRVVEINEINDEDDVQVMGESSSGSNQRAKKTASSGPIIEEIID